MNFARFSHNWNDGIMECWNNGFWEIGLMVCHADAGLNKILSA